MLVHIQYKTVLLRFEREVPIVLSVRVAMIRYDHSARFSLRLAERGEYLIGIPSQRHLTRCWRTMGLLSRCLCLRREIACASRAHCGEREDAQRERNEE